MLMSLASECVIMDILFSILDCITMRGHENQCLYFYKHLFDSTVTILHKTLDVLSFATV